MKRFSAFCLMFFVSVIPTMPLDAVEVALEKSPENNQQKSDKDAKREADIKAKAELLGVGAEIKIVMRSVLYRRDPETHRGIIDEISADGLSLQAKDETMRFRFSQIDRLNLTKNKYKAKGDADPVAVRRVVVEIGMGKKINLKLGSDQKSKGTIYSIASDDFAIVDSETDLIETVLFTDVIEISKTGMSNWLKYTIIGGAGLFIFGLIYAATADLG